MDDILDSHVVESRGGPLLDPIGLEIPQTFRAL
jgi:hypothetical protein